MLLYPFFNIFKSVGRIEIGRYLFISSWDHFLNMGLIFAFFHGCGKTPLIKLLLIRYDILGPKISGAIFKILDPMQSNPVASVLSRLFKKLFTNELLIVGMLNDVLIGTFEFLMCV